MSRRDQVSTKNEAIQEVMRIKEELSHVAFNQHAGNLPEHWGDSVFRSKRGVCSQLRIASARMGQTTDPSDNDRLTLQFMLYQSCEFLLNPRHQKHILRRYNEVIAPYYAQWLSHKPSVIITATLTFTAHLKKLFGINTCDESSEHAPLISAVVGDSESRHAEQCRLQLAAEQNRVSGSYQRITTGQPGQRSSGLFASSNNEELAQDDSDQSKHCCSIL